MNNFFASFYNLKCKENYYMIKLKNGKETNLSILL